MTFVLNHLFAREMLKVRDIENTLAARVAVELPHDPIVYLKAVNEGVPVVLGAPQSEAAARLRSLTNTLAGDAARDLARKT
jgi:MinD-like ATPase involved in chromosome partitioning or flagellar assembly